jgi:Na+-transporting NADH:ubiquinone oxidoreductase subunit NqrD
MSLTPQMARRIRIWVITACIVVGAVLPFLIPGAAAVRFFTDLEARIGYGAFAVIVHALIGGLIGAGLAEFVVWVGGGARDRGRPAAHVERTRPPNDSPDR